MSLPEIRRQIGRTLVFGDQPNAQGGLSTVWLAATETAHGPAAAVLRVLRPHLDESPALNASFLRTARFRHQLQGAGFVPRVFHAFRDEAGLLSIVEEHAGEVDLPRLLDARAAARKPMPIGFAIRLGRTIAAMHEATTRLAPDARPEYAESDITLGWDGGIRVRADDGPAWNEPSHGAAIGILRGQFSLMAPEVIHGQRLTTRSWMYGAGVLLYRALVGHHPLHEGLESEFQRIHATVSREVPSPSVARKDIPPDLAAIVVRCTRPSPDERFGSWIEVLDALDDVSSQVERFGDEHLAWILQELDPAGCAAAAARTKALAALDFSKRTSEPYVTLPLPPLDPPAAMPERVSPPPFETDLDGAVWGRDARPALRAGALLVDIRPVTNAEYSRFVIASGAQPPPHWGARIPPGSIDTAPVTFVSREDALRYAEWAGKRLPTLEEWRAVAAELGGLRLATGLVWEWTVSPFRDGWSVCGGRYRDRTSEPPSATNHSYALDPAADIGFRCVSDVVT